MAKISLKTITDDILLLVRNNNISESEDLSRAQIHAWIKAYRHKLHKDKSDELKALAKQGRIDFDDLIDEDVVRKVETRYELEPVEDANSEEFINIKRTKDTLEGLFDDNELSVLAVHDANGENIQYMDHVRRYYNYWRKYTYGDMTAFYKDDGHIYIQGLVDKNQLQYIYVLWLKDVDEDDDDTDKDEDDIKIPTWMVPTIKELIMKNELAFMLNRPSDDSNNATLASVKPHGPQDEEE